MLVVSFNINGQRITIVMGVKRLDVEFAEMVMEFVLNVYHIKHYLVQVSVSVTLLITYIMVYVNHVPIIVHLVLPTQHVLPVNPLILGINLMVINVAVFKISLWIKMDFVHHVHSIAVYVKIILLAINVNHHLLYQIMDNVFVHQVTISIMAFVQLLIFAPLENITMEIMYV